MFFNKILIFLFSHIYFTNTYKIPPRPKHIPKIVFGRPYGGFSNRPGLDGMDISCGDNGLTYEEGWITQPLDHFDVNNTITWQQYYHYSLDYYNNNSGLVFFMLGGETPLRTRFICNNQYQWMVWAKKYGAAVFHIEHRYFGQSRPRPDQSVQNLQWFIPEQILEDYHVFIQQMNVKFFASVSRPKWVMFGGSYPGTLTAWMRLAYPDATIGGMASSAAVGLIFDQYNYGSNDPNCANNIKAAFVKMQSLVYSDIGRQLLEALFNLCTPFPSANNLTAKDIQFFFSNLFGTFQGINQYTGDNGNTATANGLGIPMTCQIMNNVSETDPVKRVANVIHWVNSFSGSENECMPNSYSDYIWTYKQPGYDTYAEIAAARSWNWMCCSFMGYFQTTDAGHDNGIWGSLLPIDFYVDQCIEMFSPTYNADYTYKSVQKYVNKYGGNANYKGSNVVLPNGALDPWLTLGLLPGQDNPANNVTAMIINNNAHCADMYPSSSNDNPELIAAREKMQNLLEGFINSS